MTLKKIFLFLTCFFVLTLIPNSFGMAYEDDHYNIIGRTLTQEPTVCVYEPKTDIKEGWKKLSAYANSSIIEWEHKLNEHVRGQDTWKINSEFISLEKQDQPKYCEIRIHFLPKPGNEQEEFVLAGKTYNHGINNQAIVIYYLDINLERTDDSIIGKDPNNSQLIKYIPSYSNHLALESSLKMVIKHELGHAFGLGHYISEDQDQQERWSNGSERPPSIMIPILPTKIVAAEITSQDMGEIIKIYGKDSFKDKDNFSSKDMVKEQKD